MHTHPGSETFYVLQGELSQKTPNGLMHVEFGQGMPGMSPGDPDGCLQQRCAPLERIGYVRGGPQQAVFVAGEVPVTLRAGLLKFGGSFAFFRDPDR